MKPNKKFLDEVLKKSAEYSAESIVITTIDGNILYVNPAFTKMTGFTARQVLGKQPRLWSSKSHPPGFYQEMWKTILGGKTWTGEVLNKRKDGTTYSAILAIGPILEKSKRKIKKPIAFIAIHTDISKMKKLERNLALANEKLMKLSIIDALTGVYNRRHFNESITKEWRDSIRQKNALTALMIDVDHFKKYNDFYGHQRGDHCLKKLAACFKSSLKRPRDLVARYGGEEFVILLPNTTHEGATNIAEQLLKSVRSLKIPHEGSDTSKHVSISIGLVSTIPSRNNSWEQFIDQADQMLYLSKQNGRDRVTVKNWT